MINCNITILRIICKDNITICLWLGLRHEKDDYFTDKKLGVKGLFAINKTMPTLEILENLPNCHFLDVYLKNYMRVFHQAYLVDNFEYCCNVLVDKLGGKIISEIYNSAYFKGECCYILMPDRFTIELIKDNKQFRKTDNCT